MNSIFVFLN